MGVRACECGFHLQLGSQCLHCIVCVCCKLKRVHMKFKPDDCISFNPLNEYVKLIFFCSPVKVFDYCQGILWKPEIGRQRETFVFAYIFHAFTFFLSDGKHYKWKQKLNLSLDSLSNCTGYRTIKSSEKNGSQEVHTTF